MRSRLLPADAPDRRLADQVRDGSERAFELLFERHQPQVLEFCRHMLGSREEAEDAVQQTFLAAYRDLARGRRPRVMRPWLLGIARRRCLSLLADRRRHTPADGAEPTVAGPAGVVAIRDELRELIADLGTLPEDQRAALVLSEVGGLSHRDIAKVLDCRHDKVKALVFQAREALATGREARETPCAEIRQQLATLEGGALRRRVLRRHLRDCDDCREFRARINGRRRGLGLLLPFGPALGLKRLLAGTVLGSGGGGAVLGGGGATVAAVVAIAVPAAVVGAAVVPGDERPAAAAAHAAQFAGAAPPVRSAGTTRTVTTVGTAPSAGTRSAPAAVQAPRGATPGERPASPSAPAPSPSQAAAPAGAAAAPGSQATQERSVPEQAAGAGEAAGPPATPPGQEDAPATPPGQANRPATPPGQANRPATPPGQANAPATAPGQANRPATPPGQANAPAAPAQANRPEAPAGQANRPEAPPGQANRPAAPPGQANPPTTPAGRGANQGGAERPGASTE